MEQQEKETLEKFFATISKSFETQQQSLRKLISVLPIPSTELILKHSLLMRELIKETEKKLFGEDLSHLYTKKSVTIQRDSKYEVVNVYTHKYGTDEEYVFEWVYVTEIDLNTNIVEITTFSDENKVETIYKKALISDKSFESLLKFLKSKAIEHLNGRIKELYR